MHTAAVLGVEKGGGDNRQILKYVVTIQAFLKKGKTERTHFVKESYIIKIGEFQCWVRIIVP